MRIFIALVTFLFFVQPAWALTGRAVKIADGDTITVLAAGNKQVKIRLYGVDCPEKKQPFGQRARQYTASLVGNKTVDVEEIDTDRYGRTVGVVTVDGKNVNLELIKAGLAWLYTTYCKKSFCYAWKLEEDKARKQKKGLWGDPHAIPPWKWRKQRK